MTSLSRGLCVAGIGTGVGKTVVAASLCAWSGASYWKPIQSGIAVEQGDSACVSDLLAGGEGRIFEPAYAFMQPLSPHVAAQLDGVPIDPTKLNLPDSAKPMVVELAGGIMVPINDFTTNLDLLVQWQLPVVLVSRHYLGSINHTLLSVRVLKDAGINTLGIAFNGDELPDTERIIEVMADVPVLVRMPEVEDWTPAGFAAMSKRVWSHAGASFVAHLLRP